MNSFIHVMGSRTPHSPSSDQFAELMRLWQTQPYECRTGLSEYGKALSANPSLAMLLGQSPCITWVLDVRTGGFELVSPNAECLLGYSPRRFTAGGIAFTRDLLHPEDAAPAWKLMLRAYKCLLALPARHRPLYGINRDYRLRKADGTYVRLLEQSTVLQSDRQGNITHLLGVCTDITDLKKSEVLTASVYSSHYQTCLTYTSADEADGKPTGLSQREREIIRLVSEGYNSQQIADQLFISVHTVNTHRRNISGKTKTRTAGSLVRFALTNSIA